MPISEADKKVLLERLEKARIAKQAKGAEKKCAAEKKAPAPAPAPAPVPTPEPTPEPVEEKPPASEPIDIPPVPDLVKASRKPAKKVSLPDSDSEEEVVMPKKKKTVKKDMPYMKIKLYKRDFIKATSDINGRFYLPWGWAEMQAFSQMWPDGAPIEIEIEDHDTEAETEAKP